MNKILKACYSHYQARRDMIISKLDILLNKSSSDDANEKSIDLIKELSEINSCIATLDLIIEDNKKDLTELDSIAQALEKKINDQGNL